jgi:hypothetical protein
MKLSPHEVRCLRLSQEARQTGYPVKKALLAARASCICWALW